MKCEDCKFAKPSGFYCEDAKLFVYGTGSCNKGKKRQDGWDVVMEIKQYIDKKIQNNFESVGEIDNVCEALQDVWSLCSKKLHENGIEV